MSTLLSREELLAAAGAADAWPKNRSRSWCAEAPGATLAETRSSTTALALLKAGISPFG